MRSLVPATAPTVGAALPLARSRELLQRLDAGPPQPRPVPAPDAPIIGGSGPATVALARTQAACHDARQARWTLRDDYADARRPGRFSRLRAAVVRLRTARAAFAAAAAAYHATPRAAAERALQARYFSQ